MTTSHSKRKVAVVGSGNRFDCFSSALLEYYLDQWQIVGLCDTSQTRMDYHNRLFVEAGASPAETFPAEQFEQMLEKTKPDAVIVCTPDAHHHTYVNLALKHGVNVICEKPLTTDAGKCREIFQAVEKSGKHCRVTFNCRFRNSYRKVKELVASGVIGEVKGVTMEWLLNTSHGADYFRRWHANMAMSGGLLVHKSTHHFDLINWWVDGIPETVYAQGRLDYYGKANAIARGKEAWTRYQRYHGEAVAPDDPFNMKLEERPLHKGLYLEAEGESDSPYVRDRNVFRDDIDIYDNMSVSVSYRHGPLLTYSLVAFSPWEGVRVSLTGDQGRIEYEQVGHYHIPGEEDPSDLPEKELTIRVCPLFQMPYEVEPEPALEGGHGGSDTAMVRQIFDPVPPEDTLGANAGHEQGAASLLIGAAANESIRTGQPVKISDLLALKPSARRLHELT